MRARAARFVLRHSLYAANSWRTPPWRPRASTRSRASECDPRGSRRPTSKARYATARASTLSRGPHRKDDTVRHRARDRRCVGYRGQTGGRLQRVKPGAPWPDRAACGAQASVSSRTGCKKACRSPCAISAGHNNNGGDSGLPGRHPVINLTFKSDSDG